MHDKFCPCGWRDAACQPLSDEIETCRFCRCDEYAEVRADEREKAAERIYTAMNDVYHTDVIRDPWLVVERAVAAARGGEQE